MPAAGAMPFTLQTSPSQEQATTSSGPVKSIPENRTCAFQGLASGAESTSTAKGPFSRPEVLRVSSVASQSRGAGLSVTTLPRGRQRRRMPREDVRVGRRDGDRYVEWGASIVPWQFAQTRPKISSPGSKLAADFTGSPQSAMKAV